MTVGESETVARLCDLLQQEHVNGVPVVDERGEIVGIVTEEDILYGAMGVRGGAGEAEAGPETTVVRDIMTSPPVCATEDTELVDLCKLMWRMRIHRVPILRGNRPIGVVSAMDIVRLVVDGELRP